MREHSDRARRAGMFPSPFVEPSQRSGRMLFWPWYWPPQKIERLKYVVIDGQAAAKRRRLAASVRAQQSGKLSDTTSQQ